MSRVTEDFVERKELARGERKDLKEDRCELPYQSLWYHTARATDGHHAARQGLRRSPGQVSRESWAQLLAIMFTVVQYQTSPKLIVVCSETYLFTVNHFLGWD